MTSTADCRGPSPSRNALVIIFVTALALRLAFSFYFSKYYFGDLRYTFGDTESFTRPFLNLISKGVYTFDFGNADAYLYRPPAYPLFWGSHYLIFGADKVLKAVAFTQSFIDSGSAVLCVALATRLGCTKKWAIFSGILYALNPILFVHVPISGTETFAIFLTLSSVYLALNPEKTSNLFWAALLLAVATMTRQYLGILLPITILYLFFWSLQLRNARILIFSKKALVYSLSFCLFVSPWFLRNAIELGKPTIFMGETTGYKTYQEDYVAFSKFYNLYFVNVTPIYDSIAAKGSDGLSDHEEFGELADEVRDAARQANECGPSFVAWRAMKFAHIKSPMPSVYCKKNVVDSYESLRYRAIKMGGPALVLKAPIGNVAKSIFKQDLVHAQASIAKTLTIRSIFLFRSSYIVLGFLSIAWLWRRPEATFLLFPVAIIILISFLIRQVEIRYLAQAEALLIPYAAFSIDRLSSFVRRKSFVT